MAEVPADATKGAVLVEFFDAFVEENLIQPTIIYDYPVENSPWPSANRRSPLSPSGLNTSSAPGDGQRLQRAQ